MVVLRSDVKVLLIVYFSKDLPSSVMTKIVTDRVCGLGETINVHAQFFRRLSSQTNSKILKCRKY